MRTFPGVHPKLVSYAAGLVLGAKGFVHWQTFHRAGDAAPAELRLAQRGGGTFMQATISGKEVPLFVCQLTPETVRRCACD